MRSKKAVPILLEVIDLKDPAYSKGISLIPYTRQYPVFAALTDIGDWKTVLSSVAGTEDGFKFILIGRVLYGILGKEIYHAVLKGAIAKTSDPKELARLKKLDERF